MFRARTPQDKSIKQNHTTYTIHKRYSGLYKFHSSVAPLASAAGGSLPTFPPKTMSKLSSEGTIKRQQQLER